MVVVWSNFSKENLKNFLQTTLMEKENAIKYIKKLVEYVNCLKENNFLGKVLTRYDNKKIYQLIFEKHRVIYFIESDKIYIISVIHTVQTIEKTFDNIKYFFNDIDE